MNYLVGDIGNTLTKICLISKNFKIIKEYSIETKKLLVETNLKKFFIPLLKKKLKKRILFSSVVPNIYKKINKFLFSKNFQSFEIKNLPLKKIIKINVDNYKQVGSDRIANAAGAFNEYKENCLIVDFGTATTFDIIKKPGTARAVPQMVLLLAPPPPLKNLTDTWDQLVLVTNEKFKGSFG